MKKRYLKTWLENTLIGIVIFDTLSVGAFLDTLGNPTYNKIVFATIIINLVILKILYKWGKLFR